MGLLQRTPVLLRSAYSTMGAMRSMNCATVRVALFFALVAGITEMLIAAAKIFLLHQLAWVSRDVAWMAPLAYVIFFGLAAAGLLVAARLVNRPLSFAAAVGIFAALTAYSLLMPHAKIATVASVVLAGGIGLRIGQLVSRRPGRQAAWVRTGTMWMLAFVACTAASTRLWRTVAERRGRATLVAASKDAPNVLLLILDTGRRSSMSLHGYARPTTPMLSRLADKSVVFDGAITAAPWTLPSHASLFSGRAAGRLDASWERPFRGGDAVIAEILRDHGYLTAGFVANLLYTSWESGLARGFVHYDDYPLTLRLVLLHSAWGRTRLMAKLFDDHSRSGVVEAFRHFSLAASRAAADEVRPAPSVTDAFLDYQRTTGGRPFFAFLNYFDAHGPYRAPEQWARRFGGANPRALDRYDASIAYLDSEVGRLIDSLAARKVLENTIVVIASDHGEQFGEHSLRGHANSLYLPLLEVPLIIRYPRAVPAGRRIASAVTLREVAATIIELAGLPASLPGEPLSRFWKGPDPRASPVISELDKGIKVDTVFPNSHGSMRSIIDDSLHYIRNGRGRDELYAYRGDALESHNIATDAARRDAMARMKARVDSAVVPR